MLEIIKTMKKQILLSALLSWGTTAVIAQPNGGFENWVTAFSQENPVGWQTLNFLAVMSPLNHTSAFKATGLDKHSGNYALKLKTTNVVVNPYPSIISDTTSGIFTGKLVFSPPSYKYGFPYTGRPEKLEFWSKYAPIGNDTGFAGVLMLKWNGFTRDTIAYGLVYINPTPSYTLFQVDLTYYSLGYPDSASIAFRSSKDTISARVGSTLYIDDVALTGWVGIDELNSLKTDKVKIFPNPAKGELNIQTKIEGADNVNVFDSSGKLRGVYKIQNNNVSVNTGIFAAGNYFFDIIDKKDKVLNKGKFSVVK